MGASYTVSCNTEHQYSVWHVCINWIIYGLSRNCGGASRWVLKINVTTKITNGTSKAKKKFTHVKIVATAGHSILVDSKRGRILITITMPEWFIWILTVTLLLSSMQSVLSAYLWWLKRKISKLRKPYEQ
jgi:hypothetical protein